MKTSAVAALAAASLAALLTAACSSNGQKGFSGQGYGSNYRYALGDPWAGHRPQPRDPNEETELVVREPVKEDLPELGPRQLDSVSGVLRAPEF